MAAAVLYVCVCKREETVIYRGREKEREGVGGKNRREEWEKRVRDRETEGIAAVKGAG